MPFPWAPHQGPDKSGKHNNLLEAQWQVIDQTLAVSQYAHNQCICRTANSKQLHFFYVSIVLDESSRAKYLSNTVVDQDTISNHS